MIEFFTLEPSRLNLNGDQANVLVLQTRLKWLGLDSKLIEVEAKNFAAVTSHIKEQPKGKFLLIGHGSKAAMASLSAESDAIRDCTLQLAKNGVVGLAVGSGYEMLCPDYARVNRVSDIADIEANDGLPRIFGYINTDTNLPAISRIGANFIATMVHGPVLARTPELADALLTAMGIRVMPNANSVEADAYAEGARSH